MRSPWNHIAVLLLLEAVVFVAFRHVLDTPLWNPVDFEILRDAHVLRGNLGDYFSHLGNFFSQPLLQVVFLLESHFFGLEPAGYLAVNLAVHGLNTFVVYMLVNMLFPHGRMALTSSLLFALGVGHYGKGMLSLAGLESLLIALFYLTVLYCMIRNDFRHGGRLRTPWFLGGLGVFVLAGLTRPASFSLLGCLLVYKLLFYRERGGRSIFTPTLLILLVAGVSFYVAKVLWGYDQPPVQFGGKAGATEFTWDAFKTIFRYLNLLVFPLQVSDLVTSSHPVVRFLYEWRVPVRTLVSLGLLSFSFFGFLFGSRALRFFIAWTYITVIPAALIAGRGEWLNVRSLYLAAVGFCVILAAGTIGCARLLDAHRHRRWLPFVIPLCFAVVAMTVNSRLAGRTSTLAASPEIRRLHRLLDAELAPVDHDGAVSGSPAPIIPPREDPTGR